MIIPEPITVDLDKPRRIVFDYGAVRRIKIATGHNIHVVLTRTALTEPSKEDPQVQVPTERAMEAQALLEDPDFQLQMLCACLYEDEKTMTVDKLGGLIDSMSKFAKAFACVLDSATRFYTSGMKQEAAEEEDPLAMTTPTNGQMLTKPGRRRVSA